MAIIEIQLTDGSLDLLEGTEKSFYITKQIHDLRDLNTRNATFSKTIKIPRTNNNRNLLNYQMVDFAAYSGLPYSYIPCVVLMNGVPILEDGRIFVSGESSTDKTLSIGVFGGLIDFFANLSDDLIGDLNWSEYNFEANLTNASSYANTTEGFLFGQAGWIRNQDWSAAQADGISSSIQINDPDIRTSGGFMYFKTIIEKIIALQPNLLFDLSKLDDETLYNELVLCLPITQLVDNFTGVESNRAVVSTPVDYYNLNYSQTEEIIVFPSVEYEDPIGLWNSGTNRFDITLDGYYDINIQLGCEYQEVEQSTAGYIGYVPFNYTNTYRGMEVLIYQGSTVIFRERVPRGYKEVNASLSRYLINGDSLRVMIKGFGAPGAYAYIQGNFFIKGATADKSDYVVLSEFFPNISQKNFVKEVFKLFNAIPYYESTGVSVELWDDIINAKDIDLTPYVDASKTIEESGTLRNYGQINSLQYKENSTVTTKEIGTNFNVLNNSLPQKKVILQSLFSASDEDYQSGYNYASFPLFPMSFSHVAGNNISVQSASQIYTTPLSNDLKVGDLIFARNAANTGYQGRRRVTSVSSPTAGLVDVIFSETSSFEWDYIRRSKQEIGLRFGRVSNVTNVTIRDGGSSLVAANMKKVLFDEPLKWSSLADSYYSNLIKTVVKPTIKRLWLKLPIAIYNAISLKNPAYIDGKRWYINKLEQYSPNKLCRGEFIEIKNPLPLVQNTSYSVSFQFLDLGTVSQGENVTDNITILNNGGNVEIVDINRQGGTGIAEWSLSSAQVTLSPTISEVVVLSYQADSETLGVQTVDIRCLDQFGKEIITTVQVNVVE